MCFKRLSWTGRYYLEAAGLHLSAATLAVSSAVHLLDASTALILSVYVASAIEDRLSYLGLYALVCLVVPSP